MESYRLIPLSGKRGKGKSAIVDADLWDFLNQWQWHLQSRGYAGRRASSKDGRELVQMHRVVATTPAGMLTDHINHDRLDNRRENLRVCTARENQGNCRHQSGGSSEFKGVYWNRGRGRWRAYIQGEAKSIHLGYFSSEIDAALAYDAAAKRHFGEFAKTNF